MQCFFTSPVLSQLHFLHSFSFAFPAPIRCSRCRHMIDRYVNDEFREFDKDFSGSVLRHISSATCIVLIDIYVHDCFYFFLVILAADIDFDEFLEMYRRLFVLHKSSVSQGVSSLVRRSNPAKSPRRKVCASQPQLTHAYVTLQLCC